MTDQTLNKFAISCSNNLIYLFNAAHSTYIRDTLRWPHARNFQGGFDLNQMIKINDLNRFKS